MAFVYFYAEIAVILVTAIASAVCYSAYLVSRKRALKFAFLGFLFFFVDVALVFQDDYVINQMPELALGGYLLMRSLANIVTGTAFLTSFWLMFYSYLEQDNLLLKIAPPVIFAVACLGILLLGGDGDQARFAFYTCRALFVFWMLGFSLFAYLNTENPMERRRIARFGMQAGVIAVLECFVLVEDVTFFFLLPGNALQIGSLVLSDEHSVSENVLMVVAACMLMSISFKQLAIHRSMVPAVQENDTGRISAEDIMIYADRNGFTPREREILVLILQGCDNQNIASAMSLSPSTVKVHVHNILRKSVHANRQELIKDYWKTV